MNLRKAFYNYNEFISKAENIKAPKIYIYKGAVICSWRKDDHNRVEVIFENTEQFLVTFRHISSSEFFSEKINNVEVLIERLITFEVYQRRDLAA